MCRPYPLLPIWSVCRPPLMACLLLGLMNAATAQENSPPVSGIPAVPKSARGFLGVALKEIPREVRAQTCLKDGEGLMVCNVIIGSPAESAGLAPYDILVRFNDQWVMSQLQVGTLVENAGPGKEVELTVLHRGQEHKTKVALGAEPILPEGEKPKTLPPPASNGEMMSSVMRTLRENPQALEAVYRMFHGPLETGTDNFAGSPEAYLRCFNMRDDCGEVELSLNDSGQHLRIWDKEGKLLFDGPCQTETQRAALAPEVRERLELLEKERQNLLQRRNAPPATAPAKIKP